VSYVCSACAEPSVAWTLRCPACRKGTLVEASSRAVTAAATSHSGITTIDLDVSESPRIPLRLQSVTQALGQNVDGSAGLVIDGAYLLGGTPGAGKSTLGMMVADSVQSNGVRVLYAISESTRTMYSLLARRTGYGLKLPLLFSQDVREIIRETETSGAQYLVLDQLHRLSPREDALEHADLLVAFCKRMGVGLLMVAERAKDGSTRGDHGIEYNCDAVLGLERLDRDEVRADDPRRWLVVTKNRFGPEGRLPLMLTAKGWEATLAVDNARALVKDLLGKESA
jgi:DNA repair protein RadA/Sms